MQKIKRSIIFILILLLAVTTTAVPALADDADGSAKDTGAGQTERISEAAQETGTEVPSFAAEITGTAVNAADPSDNDECLLEYMENEVSLSSEAKKAQPGRNHLSGINRQLYDALRRCIEQVASGARTSTEFHISLRKDLSLNPSVFKQYSAEELGVEAIVRDGQITEAAQDALLAKLGEIDAKKIVSALLFDCPAELYWYNKTDTGGGLYYMPKIRASYSLLNPQKDRIFFPDDSDFVFMMTVASEYASGTYMTKKSTIDSVQKAIGNARKIVVRAAEKADYDKLAAYKDAICDAVSYNYAASASVTDYGNPWQMIWVFDENPDTNVVCEGYSKAFQFLCDASEFKSEDVVSHLVSGYIIGKTKTEGHMWNVVRMAKGENYLVDITNSDTGTVGANGGLFLAGLSDSVMSDAQNRFRVSSILYQYDAETLERYEADELLITTGAYPPPTHTPAEAVVRKQTEADCITPAGYDLVVYCSECGGEITREYVETEPAKGHSLRHVAAKPSTTTVQGNIEYWKCEACRKCFSDENGIREIREASLKIPLLEKKENPITVKAKKPVTVRASKVRKKTQKIKLKKVMTVRNAVGMKSFIKKKGNKKIRVAANGTITLKKGLKAGTYRVVILVMAAGNADYKARSKKVTVTIRVK